MGRTSADLRQFQYWPSPSRADKFGDKFYNDNRGYVNTTIPRDALTADFRVLDYVTTPGSPVSTKASFAIQEGAPGLVRG